MGETETNKYAWVPVESGPIWSKGKRTARLILSVTILLLGIAGTVLASFSLKHDAAWLSVLGISIGATVKGALMIDNYL